MKFKNISLISLIYIIPSLSFAFFCPTNFNQINFGDTVEQVKKQCGNPDKEETREVKKEGPQEWSYFVPQTVVTANMAKTQGTLKTQISFDKDGKAMNISVNGIGVGSTTICGPAISLGATRDQVKSACGDPSYINKQQLPSNNQPSDDKITEFTYNTTPPTKLIFENNKLTERK